MSLSAVSVSRTQVNACDCIPCSHSCACFCHDAQIAQTTEKGTGGGASRKRRLEAAQAAAAGGYGVDGDDAAAAFFNQSLLMQGFQGQVRGSAAKDSCFCSDGG